LKVSINCKKGDCNKTSAIHVLGPGLFSPCGIYLVDRVI